MSIFGKIVSAIFGGAANAAPAAGAPQPGVGGGASTPGTTPTSGQGGAAPMSAVDVAAVMNKLADEHDEDLDWRKSIVDLMKLLNLDSGLAARRELATELGYSGSTKDTAAMNVWLHKQVMTKLAENGGKVPDELK